MTCRDDMTYTGDGKPHDVLPIRVLLPAGAERHERLPLAEPVAAPDVLRVQRVGARAAGHLHGERRRALRAPGNHEHDHGADDVRARGGAGDDGRDVRDRDAGPAGRHGRDDGPRLAGVSGVCGRGPCASECGHGEVGRVRGLFLEVLLVA